MQTPPFRILVVDDEKPLAWTIGLLLTKAGYEVVTLNDPLLALDEVRQRPPDLIISDVVMPGMSGIELAVVLQKEQPGCRIILLSGQATTLNHLAEARADGHDFEVFPKPIQPGELLRLVESRVAAA